MEFLDVSNLAPHLKLELVPSKLVIYRQQGGSFDVRDRACPDNHIGTLVLILHSAYTGGESEVSHDDQSILMSWPFHWVAMYGDCVHKIHPVTSGARVSLFFDIIQQLEPRTKEAREGEKHAGYFIDRWLHGNPDPFKLCKKLASTDLHPKHKVDDHLQSLMHSGLSKKFEKYDTVSFCLKHLYPSCQANFDSLKGTDYLLYCALKDKYKVTVTPNTVSVNKDEDDELMMGFDAFLAGNGHKIFKKDEKNLLIVSDPPSEANIVHFRQEGYMGNEGEDRGDRVYLLAALVLRKGP